MLGLKTQESLKFNRFWQLIQDTARNFGCVLFGFAGEGRDFETPTMEGEDFSGWLVPSQEVNAFERDWVKSTDADFLEKKHPNAKFVFSLWKKSDTDISVEFKEF